MLRSFYCLLLLSFPLSLLAQDWRIFKDTSCAFTAKYPPFWVNKIKEGKRVFFTSPSENENDDFLENVNISMTKNATYGTEIKIKDAVPSVLAELTNSLDDFSKTSERYFKWNNTDACEIIYTCKPKDSEMEIKITQWFCFSKQRLFTATYTAKSNNTVYQVPAENILNSIIFR